MLHARLRAAAGRDRIPTDGLVAWYTMDNISGSTLVDEMGNYDGTIGGSPTIVTGTIGDALNFAGGGSNTEYVSVPYQVLSSNNLTISFWVYLEPVNDPSQNYQFIFGNRNATSRYYIGRTDTHVGMGLGGSGGISDYAHKGINLWQHFIWEQEGTTVRLYNDNSLIGQKTQSFSVPATFAIAAFNYPNFGGYTQCMSGSVDEFRMYNRILTEGEKTQLYNEGA